MILRGEEISTPLTVEQVGTLQLHQYDNHQSSLQTISVNTEDAVWLGCSVEVCLFCWPWRPCSCSGGGLQGLDGDGTLFSVFQLDHLQAQHAHPGQRRLQVHQHPGHLRIRELWGVFAREETLWGSLDSLTQYELKVRRRKKISGSLDQIKSLTRSIKPSDVTFYSPVPRSLIVFLIVNEEFSKRTSGIPCFSLH